MFNEVCIVTLSRSDYTSLRPLIKSLRNDTDITTLVLAGGSHVLQHFGNSIEDIYKDGIEVNHVIDFLKESDNTELDIARAYSRAYDMCLEYFSSTRPQAIFILGDRWEMMAVANAASLLRIPIIHHSGGDITQGSLDNQTRYAISMLSHIHLVALEEHRERLLRMGEEEWRVICVGEPALSDIQNCDATNICAELGLQAEATFVLACYHPTTFDELSFTEQVKFFTQVLDTIDMDIVLSAPNPDPGNLTFYETLQNYAELHANVHLRENLGAERYHAAMAAAEFMIGNSSSGIWEAPSFGLPVINIGKRQEDRFRADNVIDIDIDLDQVRHAISEVDAVRSRAGVLQKNNPYVKANTLELISEAIKQNVPRDKILAKIFVDPLTRR